MSGMVLAGPVALYFGLLVGFSRLSRSSELDAFLASWVGLHQLVRPLIILAAVMCAFSLLMFGWLQPFALLCGAGLCLGYAMLGSAWLIRKTEGALHDRSARQFRWLLRAFLVCLAIIFFLSLQLELPVAKRWVAHPILMLIPAFGLAGGLLTMAGLRRCRDGLPLVGSMMIFAATFATLAASFLPYIVPFSITYAQAAAPHASLSFLFWFAGIIVLPLTVGYAIVNFAAFWGKLSPEDDEHY